MNKNNRVSVDITFGSIFWVLFFLLAVRFVANIKDVLILVFSAVLITLAICPLVDWLEKRKIPRRLSAITLLLTFFAALISAGITIARPLTEQMDILIQKLPDLLSNLPIGFDLNQLTSQYVVPSQIYKLAVGTVTDFVAGLAVIVISFYMIQEMPNLPKYLEFWYGKEKGQRLHAITSKLEDEIGRWVRGEMMLMLIMGVLSYVGYSIVGLPYTIALGVMAGLLEIIPNIGPAVSVVPAFLVGLSISPVHAVGALVVALLAHQSENHFIAPYVMKKAAGLNPIVTIIVIMIGLELGGPALSVLALPLVLSLRVVLAHIKVNKDTNIPEID